MTDTETETETETESRTLQPITPSDYLVKNASDYVTLGSYDGIEIVQYTYDITDEMVQEQIDAARQDAATEEEKSGPSTTGDIVYVTLKSSVKDVADSEESEDTYFTIGDADYGEDFDAALTGVSTGDEKTFSIDFDDDFWIDTWAGHTVNFDATVTQVTQLLVPDYDDDFLATYTDYTTKEDYEASIRSSLEDEYTQTSYSDAIAELFQAAEAATTFNGYPQELYDSCKEDVLSAYTVFAGDDDTSIDDILDAFGITDADIDSETLDEVNHRLLISAYCEQNKLEVTEDEYVSLRDRPMPLTTVLPTLSSLKICTPAMPSYGISTNPRWQISSTKMQRSPRHRTPKMTCSPRMTSRSMRPRHFPKIQTIPKPIPILFDPNLCLTQKFVVI